jgi:hypothetical protein
MSAKGNVTIYLPLDVLARCRSVAEEENRSLSNYLSGLLERAHPPTVPRQVHIEEAIAVAVKRGPVKSVRHK